MSGECKDEPPQLNPVWEHTQLLQDIRDAFEANPDATASSVSPQLEVLKVLYGDVNIINHQTNKPFENLGITVVRLLSPQTSDIAQVRVRGLGDPRTGHIDYSLQPALTVLEQELQQQHAVRDALFRDMLGHATYRLDASTTLLNQYLRRPLLLGRALGQHLIKIA